MIYYTYNNRTEVLIIKNAVVHVKCNQAFIGELETFIKDKDMLQNELAQSFLLALKRRADEAFEKLNKRVGDTSIVSAEFAILCPFYMKEFSELIKQKTCNEFTEVYLLMDHISHIPEEKFVL